MFLSKPKPIKSKSNQTETNEWNGFLKYVFFWLSISVVDKIDFTLNRRSTCYMCTFVEDSTASLHNQESNKQVAN